MDSCQSAPPPPTSSLLSSFRTTVSEALTLHIHTHTSHHLSQGPQIHQKGSLGGFRNKLYYIEEALRLGGGSQLCMPE